MTAVFLQVRLSSTRLPRKALLPLGSQSVLERCLDVLKLVPAKHYVVLTDAASSPDIEPLAQKKGWEMFAGSAENVLDRFVQAGRQWEVDTIVRATADNPLVSPRLAAQLVQHHQRTDADYSGYQGGPLGSGVEILRRSALEQAWSGFPDAYETEHVSPYLYRRPERFRVEKPDVPPSYWLPDARVTLDTSEDLDYLVRLWNDQPDGVPVEIEELIPWLKAHPR